MQSDYEKVNTALGLLLEELFPDRSHIHLPAQLGSSFSSWAHTPFIGETTVRRRLAVTFGAELPHWLSHFIAQRNWVNF